MSGIENWIKEAEEIAIFRGAGGVGGFAGKLMLEISPTNRIITDEEAKRLIAVRMLHDCLGLRHNHLIMLADMVEAYQLTIGSPKNSREAFIEALKAQFQYRQPTDKEKRGLVGV